MAFLGGGCSLQLDALDALFNRISSLTASVLNLMWFLIGCGL